MFFEMHFFERAILIYFFEMHFLREQFLIMLYVVHLLALPLLNSFQLFYHFSQTLWLNGKDSRLLTYGTFKMLAQNQ